MATANRNVKVIEEVTSYTLQITPDEAHALRDVLRRVGGSQSSRRGLIDQVEEALEEAGVPYTTIHEPTDISGGVEVADEKESR